MILRHFPLNFFLFFAYLKGHSHEKSLYTDTTVEYVGPAGGEPDKQLSRIIMCIFCWAGRKGPGTGQRKKCAKNPRAICLRGPQRKHFFSGPGARCGPEFLSRV
jgi:hypothetical protein